MALTTYITNPKSDDTAIARYIKGLQELGWKPVLIDDGDGALPLGQLGWTSVNEITAAVVSVDECKLYWEKEGYPGRMQMYFVTGNDPDEVLADSTYRDGWNEDLDKVENAIFPDSR